jgi:hypothetical protein
LEEREAADHRDRHRGDARRETPASAVGMDGWRRVGCGRVGTEIKRRGHRLGLRHDQLVTVRSRRWRKIDPGPIERSQQFDQFVVGHRAHSLWSLAPAISKSASCESFEARNSAILTRAQCNRTDTAFGVQSSSCAISLTANPSQHRNSTISRASSDRDRSASASRPSATAVDRGTGRLSGVLDQAEAEAIGSGSTASMVGEHASRHRVQPRNHLVLDGRHVCSSAPRHREHFGGHVIGVRGRLASTTGMPPDLVEVFSEELVETSIANA